MEFTDFTHLSLLESLIQYFSEQYCQTKDRIVFTFLNKEYVLQLSHQVPSNNLSMFESIGYDDSLLEGRIARIFKIDHFHVIKPSDPNDMASEEILRTILSAIILSGIFEGTVFGALESQKILGARFNQREVSHIYTFGPAECVELEPSCHFMRLIDVCLPATKVNSHLRKILLEQNKRVYWFPWTMKENPIDNFRLQFLWPSQIEVGSDVNLDLLATAPIWFISFSTSTKNENTNAFSKLRQSIGRCGENDEQVKYISSSISEQDSLWSSSALMNLFNGTEEEFFRQLAKTLGLCLAFSFESDEFDCGLLASFWSKFVEYLRDCFLELQPIFKSNPKEMFNIHSPLIHQKLILLDYSIKKELQYQALYSRPSSSKAKYIQGRKLFQKFEDFCDSTIHVEDPINEFKNMDHGRKSKLADEMLLNHPNEPIWIPISQDPGFRSADVTALHESALMDENVSDDVKRRLRSDQLISDMQAFKAANRLAAFEDFIRWYSPKDWNEAEKRLSTRMADESNLWKALWNTAEPIIACDQKQLFDPFLEGERCLHFLEDISLCELCGFINEHLADNFLEQLRSISTQMKISGLETTDLDQMAYLLSFHYFFSIEFPRISSDLNSNVSLNQNVQIVIGEDSDRDIIIQRLNEANWTLEKDEFFPSKSSTSYILSVPGHPEYVGKILLQQ